jgi:hypothetical membrane protein
MPRFVSLAAPVAALACAAALIGFAAWLPGYSHLQHPVGLAGSTGLPRATAFNLLAFVVPGTLAALAAHALRGRLSGAPWSARIGAQALLLSGLAFAVQGVFPLDLRDIDAGSSRLHAAAWTAWWLSFAVAGVLLAVGLREGALRATGRVAALSATGGVFLALAGPLLLPAGLCQRVAFAAWFLALWWCSRRQP